MNSLLKNSSSNIINTPQSRPKNNKDIIESRAGDTQSEHWFALPVSSYLNKNQGRGESARLNHFGQNIVLKTEQSKPKSKSRSPNLSKSINRESP